MDEVVEALVNSFRKHLSARAFQFNVEKLDPSEIDISKELVEVKYCRSEWNFNSDDQILLVKDSARYF